MKTTRLIGVKCKRGDAFSWHVLIGRGLDPNLAKGTPIKATQLLFSFEGACLQKRYAKAECLAYRPVPITRRSHLFPFRTQKLSSVVPKILGWRRPGKIGRCRLSLCPFSGPLPNGRGPFFARRGGLVCVAGTASGVLLPNAFRAFKGRSFPRKALFFFVVLCDDKREKEARLC